MRAAPVNRAEWAQSSYWLSGLTLVSAVLLPVAHVLRPWVDGVLPAGHGFLEFLAFAGVLCGGALAVLTGLISAVKERRAGPVVLAVVVLGAGGAVALVVEVFTHAGGM